MKKRLLLINPISSRKISSFNFTPPVSLGVIAALTPQGWDINIVDENIEAINDYNFDLVGITTSTMFINRAYELATVFRERSIPVVMGGCHASAMPNEALQYSDAVVVGDAENVWHSLLDDFENNKLKGIYCNHGSNFDFVSPDMSFFRNKYFLNAIETSRGCHNNCSFCVTRRYRKDYKRKPVDMVIDELKCAESSFVFFIDNNFYGNDDEYLIGLFEEIIKQNIKKSWLTGVSVDFFKNRDLIKLASRSGMKMIFVGFEVDTKISLKDINKKNVFDTDDLFNEYKKIIRSCHKNNVLVISNFMIGLENDTEERILKRVETFKKLNTEICSGVILTPFPNTYIYQKLIKEDRLLYTNFPKDWSKYHYTKSLFKHNNIENKRIEELGIICRDSFNQSMMSFFKALFITKSINGIVLYYYYCTHFANYKNTFIENLLKVYYFFGRVKQREKSN